MTLYRGPGGTGSATSDADTTLYQDFLNQTIAARDAALQAEINAELAETNAETAETNAETAETNAETASTNAASSASAAASSASSASTSASNASTSASAASTSATNAASSASSASSSASAASTSASNAATSATNAANSASSASTSATNAANSASTATTQATNAASSATAAASSASSASTSATNAANSASAASTSATNAANSATSAAASATAAAASAASINPADLVHISGTETITGAKTFSQTITGSITGNAGTVTNGVYTTGDQTIAGTKTFSSNPIFNAGTANGVAYLNGSKVLTTGSALTFDGTNLGLQSATNAYAGSRNGATFRANSGNGFEFILQSTNATAGTSTGFATAVTGNDVYFVNRLDGFYSWITGASGNSEQMRLTSTGLGIGTSSPSQKLQVAGNIYMSAGDTFRIKNSASNTCFIRAEENASIAAYTYATMDGRSTGYWAFSTNDTERMRLDSSGNLGLGVTPSAWSRRAFQIEAGGSAAYLAASGGTMVLGTNVRFNSGDFYIGNGNAAYYAVQADGKHVWATAPSGTAGNAISFTQAMTLDASGNLAIGKTSASGRLDVRSNGVPITWGGTGAYDNNYGTLTWGIDLAIVQANAGYGLAFTTNGNNERARIDSSGNLLVNLTSGWGPKFITQNAGDCVGAQVTSNNNNSTFIGRNTSSSATFYVLGTGQIYSTATSIIAISDQTLKENIRNLETGLSEVMALKPRRFDWKSGEGTDTKNVAGFVAQEVEQVLPELVTDYQYSEGVTKKSLKMGDILPTLVKAIQEQQAIINQLKADVAALKGA